MVRAFLRRSTAVLIFAVTALISQSFPPLAHGSLEFWKDAKGKTKPKIVEKIRDDRAIIVSVKGEKGTLPETERFTMSGIGWVNRDAAKIYALASEIDRLKEVSENFREVKWDPKTERVFIIAEALGYQARMLIKIDFKPDARPRRIDFRVVEGHFLGLKGSLELAEITATQTEVTIRADVQAKELPVPRFLMGFALEVVVQRVAGKMRAHFETAEPRVKPKS